MKNLHQRADKLLADAEQGKPVYKELALLAEEAHLLGVRLPQVKAAYAALRRVKKQRAQALGFLSEEVRKEGLQPRRFRNRVLAVRSDGEVAYALTIRGDKIIPKVRVVV